MSGKRVGGGAYDRRSLMRRRIIFGGEEAFWRGRRVLVLGLDFLVLWWSSAVLEDHYGGHQVARGF
jgi:hypothetical protein